MIVQDGEQMKERFTESDKSSASSDQEAGDQSQYLDKQFALVDATAGKHGKKDSKQFDLLKNSLRKINKMEESMKRSKQIEKEVDS